MALVSGMSSLFPALVAGIFLASIGLVRSTAQAAPPNVVIVSIDTMRADRVGMAGADQRSLTPNLVAFAKGAHVFESAFSVSNETLFSHAALFTGQKPSAHGELSYLAFALDPQYPSLAQNLKTQGYVTEAVVAGGHLAPIFGLDKGFDRYNSLGSFGSFQATVPAAIDALGRLRQGESPFLLFVHGYDCHSPYPKPGLMFRLESPGYKGPMLALARQPLTYERIRWGTYFPNFQPEQLVSDDGVGFLSVSMFSALADHAKMPHHPRQKLDGADVDFLKGSYNAAVRYADHFLGILLESIAQVEGDTVVIVLSDHGEDLMDHGFFNHRIGLFDENTQVVLMMAGPKIPAAKDMGVASLGAVYDTVVGLAQGHKRGLLGPQRSPDGVAYSESLRGEVSVRTAAGRLILSDGYTMPSTPPSLAPEGSVLLGPDGQILDWSDPALAGLWAALLGAGA